MTDVLNFVPAPQLKTESTTFRSLEEQIQFIPQNEQSLDKFQQWAVTKPPIRAESVQAMSAQIVLWPKEASQQNQYECLAFPAFREKFQPAGWILYRINGEDFPEIPNGPKQRKTHLLRNSKDGWVIPSELESIEKSETIWKVEGIPDALALFLFLPEGNTIVTNTHEPSQRRIVHFRSSRTRGWLSSVIVTNQVKQVESDL